MGAVKQLEQTWPVVEIFGPTIQGEGVDQGVVTHFVRFGGCDYRCTWCDTPYAVLPAEVRANATKMSTEDITQRLMKLDNPEGGCAPWVVLSGGNPALHDLNDLVNELHDCGYMVAVETQGSRWREWMRKVDRLCVSPKPPSAFEKKSRNGANDRMPNEAIHRFLEEGLQARMDDSREYEWLFIKIPIFDDDDLDFAELMRSQLSDALLYLSAGNDAGRTVGNPERRDTRTIASVRRDLCDKYRWLVEATFKRPALCRPDVIVQAQMHVLTWGNEKGR
jgi:7-carboxy-7-deazaguanine synthase